MWILVIPFWPGIYVAYKIFLFHTEDRLLSTCAACFIAFLCVMGLGGNG